MASRSGTRSTVTPMGRRSSSGRRDHDVRHQLRRRVAMACKGPPSDRGRAPMSWPHARHRPAHVDQALCRRCRRTRRPGGGRRARRPGGGFSLGAPTATGVAVRHPAEGPAARPAPWSTSGPTNTTPRSRHRSRTIPACRPRRSWRAGIRALTQAVAPDPNVLLSVPRADATGRPRLAGLERRRDPPGDCPHASIVIGDQDFVRLDHAAEMLGLFPDCRLAVLPRTKHTEVMQRPAAAAARARRAFPGLSAAGVTVVRWSCPPKNFVCSAA